MINELLNKLFFIRDIDELGDKDTYKVH